jgi:hypothetical protein
MGSVLAMGADKGRAATSNVAADARRQRRARAASLSEVHEARAVLGRASKRAPRSGLVPAEQLSEPIVELAADLQG